MIDFEVGGVFEGEINCREAEILSGLNEGGGNGGVW